MSEQDYETLFNEILVKTRERRKSLKELLDRYFDEDPVRVTEILADMIRVNDRAQTIEANRASFMSLMTALRAVRASRDEVLVKIDKLMDEVRQFLSIKEEMANERLEKVTQLFREELGHSSFKFQFHLLDDQELHHLSELRSLGRKVAHADVSADESAPEPEALRSAPVPEHSILERPAPAIEGEPSLMREAEQRYFTHDLVPAAELQQRHKPSHPEWDAQPVTIKSEERTTLHGVPPDEAFTDEEISLPEVAIEPEEKQEQSGPYEVDVDVLKILSEETFNPARKGR